MSFRLYIRAIADSSQTEIFNNTTSINTYIEPQQIAIIGINYNLNITVTDAINSYIDVVLPVYETQLKTYYYRELPTTREQRQNLEDFKRGLLTMGTDYVLLFINSLDGFEVDSGILKHIESQTQSQLLRGKTTGGWMILLKPYKKGRFENRNYTKLVEKYNVDSDIDLYYLTQTEFTYMNRDTWNSLFRDQSSDLDIKTYYQDFFDQLDPLVYDEDSDFVQILARIHHHLTHPRDDNFDGLIAEGSSEIAYYTANPDQLQIDIDKVRSDVKIIASSSKRAGIDILHDNAKSVRGQKINFISNRMIDVMMDYRSLYIDIREEFYDKLDL